MVKKKVSARGKKQTTQTKKDSMNMLTRGALWFFDRTRLTAVLLSVLVASGIFVYTNVIKREGFPAIQFPLTVVSGTYLVNDPAAVDADVTKPLSDALQDYEGIDKLQTSAQANFYSVIIQFEQSVNAEMATQEVEQYLADQQVLPESTQASFTVVDPSAFLNEYDLLLSVYSDNRMIPVAELELAGEAVATAFSDVEGVENAELVKQTAVGKNPATGEETTVQRNFNRIGFRDESGDMQFYPSVSVGVSSTDDVDILQLSDLVDENIMQLSLDEFDQINVVAGADQADSIETQVSSLQNNLLSGLLAVSVISLLLITWRASIITAIFMVSVVLVSVLLLYLFGYTLNTITLFALVLSLGLFVDDATIVVEAIDAQRGKKKKTRDVVAQALKKVASASFAGTMTTVLVFAPLIFISGILGEFIRLMPITVIIALFTSLTLSLTLIPLLSRFVLLRSDKISWITRVNPIAKFERKAGEFVGGLLLSLRKNRVRRILLPTGAFLISFLFLFGTGYFASQISTNIFPPTKDSDQIGFTLLYSTGTSIERAQELSDQANTAAAEALGENLQRVVYGTAGFGSGEPNERSASALVELVSFNEREVKSPELLDQLRAGLESALPADEVSVQVTQFDAGPPLERFPFKVQIYGDDIAQSVVLAEEFETVLADITVDVPGGDTAQVVETRIDNVQVIVRNDGKRFIEVGAAYDSSEVTTLLEDTREQLQAVFTEERLADFGFEDSAVTYDFGQESENEDSFSSLGLIFPLALALMFILLALQFRSLLQPLLIFMAIPFSLFGVMAGLYFTDNGFSFFVMVGLIGLIGIAVNNTILLTDYINQERRAGARVIDAVAAASEKRFRPLLTTSLTTVVALLPLAMSDPFWEALAYTIMFGLLSSTFLVIVSFPYYYLAAEWVRARVNRGFRKLFKRA